MRGLLNSLAVPWVIVIAIVLTVTAVALAVLLVRRIVPSTREGFHAEISAPMLGVVAALFGLILAFVIIIAYQNYLDAQANVSREADALASIVRDSESFPAPGGANVRHAVGTYVHGVTEAEWPQMRNGNGSALAEKGIDEIFAAFRTVAPTTTVQRTFYTNAVDQLNDAVQARRDRIDAAAGGLPRDMWILLLFTSFVIVAYAVLVGSPNFWFHLLGPVAIAMVIIVSLVVLADLSYPFSGDVAISSDPFASGILRQFF
jgi:hypothetical protein